MLCVVKCVVMMCLVTLKADFKDVNHKMLYFYETKFEDCEDEFEDKSCLLKGDELDEIVICNEIQSQNWYPFVTLFCGKQSVTVSFE